MDEAIWAITMRGRRGFTCVASVSCANAKTAEEAMQILGWMFPELTPVSACRHEPRDVPG